MLQRACGELMALKSVVVINDEAHHCYRERPEQAMKSRLSGEEKDEAKKNNEAARLWISGIEALKRKFGIAARLRSLGDAVLPARLGLSRRLAVSLGGQRLLADGRDRMRHRQAAAHPGRRQPARGEMPIYRDLWKQSGKEHAEEGRGKRGKGDPLSAARGTPDRALFPLRPLREDVRGVGACRLDVPPVFIVVCNNTSTSKLVYEWIAGFERKNEDGETDFDRRTSRAVP